MKNNYKIIIDFTFVDGEKRIEEDVSSVEEGLKLFKDTPEALCCNLFDKEEGLVLGPIFNTTYCRREDLSRPEYKDYGFLRGAIPALKKAVIIMIGQMPIFLDKGYVLRDDTLVSIN